MFDTEWSKRVNLDSPNYHSYPSNQPFIFDDYRREPDKPVKAYPENSRKDIVAALKNLQDKMRRLELEKNQQYLTVSEESLRRTESAIRQNERVETAEKSMMTDGIHLKLDQAEERCQLLEKQLNNMRNTVQQAEIDRSDTLRKSALLRETHASPPRSKHQGQGQVEKLVDLEREQLRLMAMQTLAASQIQELEEKLHTERHYRKMMQNKAAELESATAANRILIESDRDNKTSLSKKKKRSVSAGKSPARGRHPSARRKAPVVGRTTSEHYRLNLAEIPFINGKSTGKSHSLSANFQEVLSLMKSHTPRLCRAPSHSSRSHRHRTDDDENHYRGQSVDDDNNDDAEIETADSLPDSGLSFLLVQLQDEFGHMSFEHKELLSQIQEATDQKTREDLERELDCLVLRMETKGDQIKRLRQYQDALVKKKNRRGKPRTPASRTSSSTRTCASSKSVSDHQSQRKTRPTPSVNCLGEPKPHGSLTLLKDLKRIQASLRAEDIAWDC